jgi:hypothetical protein
LVGRRDLEPQLSMIEDMNFFIMRKIVKVV